LTRDRKWKTYNFWPENAAKESFYLVQDKLMTDWQTMASFKSSLVTQKSQFLSRRILIKRITPRKYMTDDQRFAARRPDVLVYETEILKDNMTLAGDILAELQVSTSGTEIDCKVIDVFPNDEQETPEVAPYLK
jgi:predicted acyl esterase